MIFCRWGLWELIMVRWGRSWGWSPYGEISVFIRRETRELVLSFSSMWGHSRRWPSASQKEVYHQNPTMLVAWSQTSGLRDGEEINFCYLSHPVYVILLWQPEMTKTLVLSLYLISDFVKTNLKTKQNKQKNNSHKNSEAHYYDIKKQIYLKRGIGELLLQ